MKTLILIVSFIFFTVGMNAQEEHIDDRSGEWMVSNYFGWATLEVVDTYKFQAQVYGGNLGRSFKLTKMLSVVALFEHLKVSGDHLYSDAQAFETFHYLKVPVLIHFLSSQLSSLQVYINAGPYLSHLYRQKTELLDNSVIINKGLGSNFGLQYGIGVRHQFNPNFDVKLGMIAQKDLSSNYQGQFNDIKIQELYAVQFSIGFVF